MTGSMIPAAEFTFSAFREFTPELPDHRRAAVFVRLPDKMRQQAWAELVERSKLVNDTLAEGER